MLDNIENSLSPDLKKALPYLLAGGGGALLGGMATGRRHKRDGEGKLGYTGRLAKNMALAGLLAGGGAFALHKGMGALSDSIDFKNPRTGSDPELNPVATGMRNIAFSPLTAGLAGGGALALTTKGIKADAASAQKNVASKMFSGDSAEATLEHAKAPLLQGATKDLIGKTDEIARPGLIAKLHEAGVPTYAARHAANAEGAKTLAQKLMDYKGTGAGAANKLGQVAGHGAVTKAVDLAERAYRRTPFAAPGKFLGQTLEHAGPRVALGAGAALLPALLGSIFTDKQQ